MKKIKIFAAAGSGMTEDIKKLENFVGLLNVMHEGSACLIVYKDNASVEEELRRAEAEIAADIDQADYFALILGRDADDRAIAELFRAAERLKKRENKDTSENSILKDKDVAAKSASVADTLQAKDALKNKDIKEIKSINVYLKKDGEDDAKILAILDKFSAEPLKHYVERYSEIDTLKLKILIQLSAGENEFGESDDYSLPVLKYEIGSDDNGDPIVLIGKTPVLGLVSYDALLNSGSYRRSKRSVSELEAELEEVSERARIEQKKGSLIAGGLW
ncbi:MAG: hypothetical protein LBT20_07775, partial [Clostridiales bacterium]|nr:hypothetical protein [Clostridiales bacterium]